MRRGGSSARADWKTETSLGEIVELIAPQGRLSLIGDPATLDLLLFEAKSVSVHWKQMFTRARFDTADMEEQGRLLAEISRLVDTGK